MSGLRFHSYKSVRTDDNLDFGMIALSVIKDVQVPSSSCRRSNFHPDGNEEIQVPNFDRAGSQ